MKESLIPWLWLLLGVFSVILAAYYFRYEPIGTSGDIALWDRYERRVCIFDPDAFHCYDRAKPQ